MNENPYVPLPYNKIEISSKTEKTILTVIFEE
jgi:hypothetical protein